MTHTEVLKILRKYAPDLASGKYSVYKSEYEPLLIIYEIAIKEKDIVGESLGSVTISTSEVNPIKSTPSIKKGVGLLKGVDLTDDYYTIEFDKGWIKNENIKAIMPVSNMIEMLKE